jgi:hypothetical protein
LLGELDPAPYHVGNIVLHALASVLVAELASRIVPGKVQQASLARQSAVAFLDDLEPIDACADAVSDSPLTKWSLTQEKVMSLTIAWSRESQFLPNNMFLSMPGRSTRASWQGCCLLPIPCTQTPLPGSRHMEQAAH